MSSFETCPKCSYVVPTGAVECPACGIVYAKYRDASSERPVSSGAGSGEPFNPYAPPKSDLFEPGAPAGGAGGDVWRTGNLLVMSRTAVLPDRCVRCNRPAEVRLRRKLSWHRPLLYLVLFIHFLIYVVIAMIVRKRAEINVPLCGEHERARKSRLLIMWVVVLGSLALCVAGFTSQDLVGLLPLGMLGCLVGLILVVAATQPVVPKKIDEHHIWLKKVSPDYLAGLPQAPSHLAPS